MSGYCVGRVEIEMFSDGTSRTQIWNPMIDGQVTKDEQIELLNMAQFTFTRYIFQYNERLLRTTRVRNFVNALKKSEAQ